MLKYKELKWDNCFSYGEGNAIRFDENPITQLVGKNGHGKSSVALILEEILYNKNSKGIKKDHILNRNSTSKSYNIELSFVKDGSEYRVEVSRGSVQKVKLFKDGNDISSHTATATFKELEAIVGHGHKTFGQIVYQSSTSSLEFLTATDTQRKKFLIDLLNLNRYSLALDLFKEELLALGKNLSAQEAKADQARVWLTKYSKESLQTKPLLPVPEEPIELERELPGLLAKLLTIDSDNKAILQNNKYKELLDSVVLPPVPQESFSEELFNSTRSELAVASSKRSAVEAELKKLRTTKTTCPTCGTSIVGPEQASHLEAALTSKYAELNELKASEVLLQGKLSKLQTCKREHETYENSAAEYEKYHSMWKPDMPTTILDPSTLKSSIARNKETISARRAEISEVNALNQKIHADNIKCALLVQQMQDMQAVLEQAEREVIKLTKRQSNLSVLVKAFSTTGLVAYKIEGLVKDLESITNEYLADMADGRFQLSFQVSSTDKLNVVITDNGEDIDINALSSGERARVNIATLLAIRSLMQSLSNTRTNLLILDETVESLDLEGKEKLVEVLLKEEGLNTFLISHSFTHPLIERIGVEKTDGISRLSLV